MHVFTCIKMICLSFYVRHSVLSPQFGAIPYHQGWPEPYRHCICGMFVWEITKYTVIYCIYCVYIWFWPTLLTHDYCTRFTKAYEIIQKGENAGHDQSNDCCTWFKKSYEIIQKEEDAHWPEPSKQMLRLLSSISSPSKFTFTYDGCAHNATSQPYTKPHTYVKSVLNCAIMLVDC